MKSIPFFDLKRQNRQLRGELTAAFLRGLKNTDYILGAEVEKFESNFARFVGTRHAVGVNSGLDALSLALRVLGIGPGSEVMVPANSFIATALAVTSVGATPVFVDARPGDLLMDMDSVKRAFTPRTKAVIPVHLYGRPADMKTLLDLCRPRRVFVVEDACQAHGASIGKKRCGSFGQLGCFSFYPGKNLGALGDGGIVTTDDDAFYEKLLLLRNYGSVVKYRHRVAGFNTRLDALQAAFLNVKLRYLEGWNAQRALLAARYDLRLKKLRGIEILKGQKGHASVHHLYVVRVDDRDGLKEFLHQKGIGTGIHYPIAIHRQPAYEDALSRTPPLPVCERESPRLLSLPMYPEMPLSDVDCVCRAIRDFLKHQ